MEFVPVQWRSIMLGIAATATAATAAAAAAAAGSSTSTAAAIYDLCCRNVHDGRLLGYLSLPLSGWGWYIYHGHYMRWTVFQMLRGNLV